MFSLTQAAEPPTAGDTPTLSEPELGVSYDVNETESNGGSL